jgi:ketosteroid isomerase-like protein
MDSQEAAADNEREVRKVIENWARAISSGNRAEILAHHVGDFLMFDLAATERGIDAYDRSWDFFYADPKGPITFAPMDLNITAGEDVAFASCMVHCDGTSAGPLDLRLTIGLRKVGGEWAIVHEHHSIPTVEEKFIDPGFEDSTDYSRGLAH